MPPCKCKYGNTTVLVKLFNLVSQSCSVCFVNPDCDLTIGRKCYVHINQSINWYEAEACCVSWGGHLASIHSIAENDVLSSIRNDFRFTWIGLVDINGTYVWTDGTAYDYNNFSLGQPTIDSANCVHFFNTDVGEAWNDSVCTNNEVLTSYICQNILPSPPTSPSLFITSLNESTCSATVNISWTPTNEQDVSYFINLDGSEVARTNFSNYLHVSTFIPNSVSNYTYSLAATNCIDVSSDIYVNTVLIPAHDFVNGSSDVTFSPLTNTFTYSWELKKNPPTVPSYVIELGILISQSVDYKFIEQDIWYTLTTKFEERFYLSNVTSADVPFLYEQAGLTLEIILLTLHHQIVSQCGFGINGQIYTQVFNITLEYDVPDAPPQNLSATSLNATAINVCFNPPPALYQKGPINSFNITYVGLVFDRTPVSIRLLVSPIMFPLIGSHCINLTCLQENNNYSLIAFAINNVGAGPDSQPIIQLTDQAAPSSPPINITLTTIGSTTIRVEWKEPDLIDQNGILTTYQIIYNRKDVDLRTRIVEVLPGTFSSDLTALTAGASYCVRMRVATFVGFSEYSSLICAWTIDLMCPVGNCKDTDNDGHADDMDNCPLNSNPDQNDCDGNKIGDVCDDTCEPEVDSIFKLHWPCSKSGDVVKLACGVNNAIRLCMLSGDWDEKIDTTNCTSPEYVGVSNLTSVEGLDVVLKVINEREPTFAGDVIAVVDVLESTIEATAQSNEIENIVNKTIQVVDFLTDTSQQQLLNQTQQQTGVAQKIIVLLERQARVLLVNHNLAVRLSESRNVFFETRIIMPDQTEDVLLTADNIRIEGQLPPRVNIPIQDNFGGNQATSVSVLVLRNIADLITDYADSITLGKSGLKLSSFSRFEIVTPLVSVQIFSREQLVTIDSKNTLVNLIMPLNLNSIKNSQTYFKLTCLYLANLESDRSEWQDIGIRNVSLNDVAHDNTLTCYSGHATAFVVLVGVNNIETTAMNILSYIGCSVSIICLMISIAIYLIFGRKLLKKIYHFVHFYLAFSLCLLYIVFLLGVELAYADIWHYIPCKMVTVTVQYLLLVVFLWMLFEGVVILIMIIWPFHVFTWKDSVVFFCIAWFLPALYVTPFIPFFHNSYLSPHTSNSSNTVKYCWLHNDENTHIIYSVTVPIALIIFVNFVILTIVIIRFIMLVVKQRSLSKLQRVQQTALRLFRLILVLFPVLGFGWAFGLLAVYFNHVVFAWLFTILCSLQGLIILTFVLLLRRDIQQSIISTLNLKKHFSTIQFRISNLSSKLSETKYLVGTKHTSNLSETNYERKNIANSSPELEIEDLTMTSQGKPWKIGLYTTGEESEWLDMINSPRF